MTKFPVKIELSDHVLEESRYNLIYCITDTIFFQQWRTQRARLTQGVFSKGVVKGKSMLESKFVGVTGGTSTKLRSLG